MAKKSTKEANEKNQPQNLDANAALKKKNFQVYMRR